MHATHLVHKGMHGILDVLGPTVEFLTSPSEQGAVYCVIRGTIPPGVSVPLHSHSDAESFFVVSGAAEILTQRGDRLEWLKVKAGDFVHIPGGAKHAHRNTSNEPVVELITTTPRLGQFFQEIGRPITSGTPTTPPTRRRASALRAVGRPVPRLAGQPCRERSRRNRASLRLFRRRWKGL